MGLLGKMFGKDDKKEKSCCCEMEIVEIPEGEEASDICGCGCDAPSGDEVTLTVLGPGCKRCHELNDHANAVASKSARKVSVDYVTDPVAIAETGIMSTPALLVNGKVVSQGKVLSESEIEALL